jgi:phosphoglycolate phosphatase
VSKVNRLVLFDIDGTLLRGAGPHHKQALVQAIYRVTGLSTTLEGVPTSGMLDRDLIVRMLLDSGCSRRRIHASLLRILEEARRAYLRNCATDLRSAVCTGVLEFLKTLREERIALGLVTGNLSAIAWKKLELAALRGFFSIGAFSEDGTTRTHLARLAADRARTRGLITADAEIALVGDHSNDIQAAKANGFRAVAVATGFTSVEELQSFQPAITVSNLRELTPDELWRR